MVSIVIAVLILGGLAYLFFPKFHADEKNQALVQNVVETFGKRLQNVNLAAEDIDVLSVSMEENYGKLLEDPLLIVSWLRNPQNAPGRMVSSPWPDHIEILSTTKITDTKYEVRGNIVEITSDEVSDACVGVAGIDTEIEGCTLDGFAAKRPISVTVEKSGKKGHPWLITAVTLGQYSIGKEPHWQSTRDDEVGFTYEYPDRLDAEYISFENIPPMITVNSKVKKLTCKTTKETSSLPERVSKQTINDNEYCITAKSDGTADGSITDFTYSTITEEYGLTSVLFSVNYLQCNNLESEEETKCSEERENFDLDTIADKIIASIKN